MTRELEPQALLLRGINVGGHRKLPMADLRAWCAAEGWADVATYIQSGNVALRAPTAPADTARRLAEIVEARAGFDVRVLGRSAAELGAVAAEATAHFGSSDPSRVLVVFRDDTEALEDLERRLAGVDAGDDRWWFAPTHLLLDVPNGQSRSKVAEVVMASAIGRAGTARNLRTVAKLVEMVTS